MICPDCRQAGALNSDAERASTDHAWGVLSRDAIQLHELCKGGTWCACQHKTGQQLTVEARRG